MRSNKAKRAKKLRGIKRNQPPPPLPEGLRFGFGLGLAVLGSLLGAIQEWDADVPDKPGLPPPTDDLKLNPETGNYE